MKNIGQLLKYLPGSFLSKIKTLSLVFLVLYVLSPFDLIPESVPFLGFLDDIALVVIYFLKIRKNRGEADSGQTKEIKKRTRLDSERILFPKRVDPDDPYHILGIAAPASQQEIKLAFRKLVKEYHPDLVSREARNKKGDKLLQITEAYERLRKVA